MKLNVDQEKCIGCGACVAIAPENFDFDEDMLAKLETAKGGDYDVIIADDYIIELAIQEGLVQKLDTEKISNLG